MTEIVIAEILCGIHPSQGLYACLHADLLGIAIRAQIVEATAPKWEPFFLPIMAELIKHVTRTVKEEGLLSQYKLKIEWKDSGWKRTATSVSHLHAHARTHTLARSHARMRVGQGCTRAPQAFRKTAHTRSGSAWWARIHVGIANSMRGCEHVGTRTYRNGAYQMPIAG